MKNYTQAPLPFQGQKRRFLKAFKQCLNSFKTDATYIDLFGGSGLLAHTVKQKYPNARIIWNDYDNYAKRLAAIPQTNALTAELRGVLSGYPTKQRLTDELRKSVLEVVKRHEVDFGYIDYTTLSTQLLFSAKYVTNYEWLTKETMYNRHRTTNYDATGYLQGVERVCYDYQELYLEHKNNANVVYLVDPPYLSTDTTTYSKDNYWRLRDYLDVLNVLDDSNYFYFTSNKSQIVELCEWIETMTFVGNPFEGGTTITTDTTLNKDASYTDIMIYDYKKSRD